MPCDNTCISVVCPLALYVLLVSAMTLTQLRQQAEAAKRHYETVVKATPEDPDAHTASDRQAIRVARDAYYVALIAYNTARGV